MTGRELYDDILRQRDNLRNQRLNPTILRIGKRAFSQLIDLVLWTVPENEKPQLVAGAFLGMDIEEHTDPDAAEVVQ